jgi:recombination protein RecA
LKDFRKKMASDLKDSFVILNDDSDSISDVRHFVSTGCTALNYIISNRRDGGIPIGKITSISGLPASGKSLMAIHLCADTQKQGGLAIFFDNENAFNEDYAKRVGLDIDAESFWYVNPAPPDVEGIFHFLFKLSSNIDTLKKKDEEKRKKDPNATPEWGYKFVTVIWDSVASTPCKADLENENPDPASTVGLKPRVISKNLTTFLSSAAKKDIGFICLNQLRANIKAQPFTDPWVEPGGNAIPFMASVRIRLASISKLRTKDKTEVIGIETEAKVVKTRFGPPFRSVTFPIYFTHGIDDPEGILVCLEKYQGIQSTKSGPKRLWFNGEENEKFTRIDFKRRFMEDPVFKQKALDVFETTMTKDLGDPKLQELEKAED